MINALDPADMATSERLNEVASILGAGLARLQCRPPSTRAHGTRHSATTRLDFSPPESVHDLEPADGRKER